MINLGDEVKDSITGFKGVAVTRHIYLQGCHRITVQTKVTKSKPEPFEMSFDEPQLIVTKAVTPKLEPVSQRGGPERHMPSAKSTGNR